MRPLKKGERGKKKMKLKIILPYKIVLDRKVCKITAPGVEGDFQILPKHIDGTWSLKAGILVIGIDDDSEKNLYFAIGRGVLVKEGNTIYLSCFQAIKGSSLEGLTETVRKDLEVLNERERKTREVLLRLEIDTVKKFMEIEL